MYLTLTRLILVFSLIEIIVSSGQIPLLKIDRISPTVKAIQSDVVMLSDILGISRVVGGFAGMTRNFPHITNRLEDYRMHKTVLAPTDEAIAAMPRKPWENPDEYSTLGSEAYEGEEGEERADQNLQKFVESHIIPLSPWADKMKVETLAGTEYWWHLKDGYRIIQPGDIKVLDVMRSSEEDSELWIIDGVMS
ncbi:FAS1 domain-containing protein [Erysiphe neolycopersici]|uniref:FAS1 domain-containing protein n=1 Tax=Erysiphe neolycopersici TaxID=212602 RepID=A0A420HYB6_9PEZI|nr:FAS1 domain-containing protein [Erysiphe neolycopersici]